METLNNRVYADGELRAAFKWTTDAIDYAENESYGFELGMTVIDDKGISRHYLAGEMQNDNRMEQTIIHRVQLKGHI